MSSRLTGLIPTSMDNPPIQFAIWRRWGENQPNELPSTWIYVFLRNKASGFYPQPCFSARMDKTMYSISDAKVRGQLVWKR